MNGLTNFAIKTYFSSLIPRVKKWMAEPLAAQEKQFETLLDKAKHTEWGKKYGYAEIKDYKQFTQRVPIYTYEELQPYIQRMMQGEENILWPSNINFFSKSSGTTDAKSKYIPVSQESLNDCHYKGGSDLNAWYTHLRPEHKIFTGYALAVGGSLYPNPNKLDSFYGDVSAVIMHNLPSFIRNFRKPDLSIALMDKWEDKIEALANNTMDENITNISGVPTWMFVLLNYILEARQVKSIHEVWPNLEVFLHGAVNFAPYRELFKNIIPGEQMAYMENYNASEGYFAFQDDFSLPGEMVLLPDHGIFYEFMPMEELGKDHPITLPLEGVELHKNYAVVLNSNAGLWRYLIGDTVKFTTMKPYRIKVTGRTKHFINAFGEELMVENAEAAIAEACKATDALVSEFTAAPIYFDQQGKGGHEWVIEFERAPGGDQQFVSVLDETLKSINSDYEAKRYMDIALQKPTLTKVPNGTFYEWMKRRGKLGGQHKVPRLSNNRDFVEEILSMVQNLQA